MASLHFTKMQGLGNDYIYVDVTGGCSLPELSALSQRLSDRHFGIGSDGLVLIGLSARADFSMRIFNADGSEAKMCGNASRCIGKYLYDRGLTDKTEITLDTLSGIKVLRLNIGSDGKVASVTVDMGCFKPLPDSQGKVYRADDINVLDTCFKAYTIDMGNPHIVLMVDCLSDYDIARYGYALEHSPLFPDGINVEFAQVLSPSSVRMRVWERGSGITMACGTGACATASAAVLSGAVERPCEIIMDGGTLVIDSDPLTGRVLMTGPAAFVFDGTVEI